VVIDCCRASSYVRDLAGAVALLRTEVRRANPPLNLFKKLSWEIGLCDFGGKRLGSEKGFRGSDLFSDNTDIGLKVAVFRASMTLSLSDSPSTPRIVHSVSSNFSQRLKMMKKKWKKSVKDKSIEPFLES
jgi:hypothetical protein